MPDEFRFTVKQIDDFGKKVKDVKPLLQQVGALLTARIQDSFQQQRRGEISWIARRVPNIAGILMDFKQGRNPPPKRFEPRPALVDTGRLRNTITWLVVGEQSVEVGSPEEYANIHHTGGRVTIAVTRDIRKRLAKFVKRSPTRPFGGVGGKRGFALTRASRQALGWLFRRDSVTINIPARPFARVTEQDATDISTLIKNLIERKR